MEEIWEPDLIHPLTSNGKTAVKFWDSGNLLHVRLTAGRVAITITLISRSVWYKGCTGCSDAPHVRQCQRNAMRCCADPRVDLATRPDGRGRRTCRRKQQTRQWKLLGRPTTYTLRFGMFRPHLSIKQNQLSYPQTKQYEACCVPIHAGTWGLSPICCKVAKGSESWKSQSKLGCQWTWHALLRPPYLGSHFEAYPSHQHSAISLLW